MSKITGVIEHVDLEGGFYRLVTETGKFLLNFSEDFTEVESLNGREVTVVGEAVETMGFAMTEDTQFRVDSLTFE